MHRLRAGADQPQHPGVRPGEMAAGQRAGRTCANPGQIIGADEAGWLPAVGIEQQGRRLVIGPAGRGIARPISSSLQPQYGEATVVARLDTEHRLGTANGFAHHRKGARFFLMSRLEGRSHRLDGVLNGDKLARQLFGYDKHADPHGRPTVILGIPIPAGSANAASACGHAGLAWRHAPEACWAADSL